MENFIDRLNLILKKRKMNGTELCKKIGMKGNAAYSKWKESIPNGKTLIEISKILDVSVDYLLGKDNTPEEGEIISFYRKADDRGKDRIYKTAKDEADQAKQLHQKENNITEFPEENKPFA